MQTDTDLKARRNMRKSSKTILELGGTNHEVLRESQLNVGEKVFSFIPSTVTVELQQCIFVLLIIPRQHIPRMYFI